MTPRISDRSFSLDHVSSTQRDDLVGVDADALTLFLLPIGRLEDLVAFLHEAVPAFAKDLAMQSDRSFSIYRDLHPIRPDMTAVSTDDCVALIRLPIGRIQDLLEFLAWAVPQYIANAKVNTGFDQRNELANQNGLGHWKCVSMSRNDWWRRDDGLEADSSRRGDTWDLLSEFDENNPMSGDGEGQ